MIFRLRGAESTSGRSLAKLSLSGQAARAASRSAPAQSRASGESAAYWRRASRAVAVLLVVGQEPRQVAQLGIGAGGDRAAAVAVGAEGRAEGEEGVAQLVDLGRLQRLERAGPRRRFRATWSVFFIDTHDRADPLVGPDRVQQALERASVSSRRAWAPSRRLP